MLFLYFSFERHVQCGRFLPALSALYSQTLNCSKTSVERSFEKVSKCLVEFSWSITARPAHVDRRGLSSNWPPLNVKLDSAIFLPVADCLSWLSHLALNSSSSDIMTSSKKLARLPLRGGENACSLFTTGPNRTAYMHYDKLPGQKKPFLLLFLFLCVCYCKQESFASLAKGSHK